MTGTGTNGAAPAWDAVTATDVGLGNVTNESKATMFTNPSFTGTLRFDSGYGSSAVAYGCRCWVNFDGTDSVAPVAVTGSGNVSSVAFVAAGNCNINFTTALPDANYSAICGTAYSGQGDMPGADTFATGSLKVRGRIIGGTAVLRNPTCVHVFR